MEIDTDSLADAFCFEPDKNARTAAKASARSLVINPPAAQADWDSLDLSSPTSVSPVESLTASWEGSGSSTNESVSERAVAVPAAAPIERPSCLLCWELSFIDVNQHTSGLNEQIQPLRDFIFAYETSRRGRKPDRSIFEMMLNLRRQWIEHLLDGAHVFYWKWTMEDIVQHYSPPTGCDPGEIRWLDYRLQQAQNEVSLLAQHRFVDNPDTGEPQLSIQTMREKRQWEQFCQSLIQQKQKMIHESQPQATALDRRLETYMAQLGVKPYSAEELDDMYSLGGLG